MEAPFTRDRSRPQHLVHHEMKSGDLEIGAELLMPKVIADHDHRCSSAIFCVAEVSSELRLNTQQAEEVR